MIRDEIAAELPVEVTAVFVNDPTVNIYGDGWNLYLACPWELKGPAVATSWASDNMTEELKVLVGASLTSVEGNQTLDDPIFRFGRIALTVQPGDLDDPWTLQLHNLRGMTGGRFVGS